MTLFSASDLRCCVPGRPVEGLEAQYRAILRFYRCNTPYRAILFKKVSTPPIWCSTPPPPFVLSFTQGHLCDSPFCNILRDTCATPHKTNTKIFWPLLRTVRPRQGTEICNFGAPSPLEALHWIFCFFSSIYVQFSKTSPLKSGESSEKSSGENRFKSCHVCGCHGFFGPDLRLRARKRCKTCMGDHALGLHTGAKHFKRDICSGIPKHVLFPPPTTLLTFLVIWDQSLSVNSPALTQSKNSGAPWLNSAQHRQKIGKQLAKDRGECLTPLVLTPW